ncbi:MAG: ABC transporter permease [Cytophagales bacterium]|nr:ABC transporter permease [Cytophagales bacterium]
MLEEIEGDLNELFAERVAAEGERAARQQYAWDVVRYLRPHTLRQSHQTRTPLYTDMLRNYFILAKRNLLQRKLYAGINLVGLSTGIAFCLLIYAFIRHEHSFDRFHADAGRIYRIDYTDRVNVSFQRRTGKFLGSFQALGGLRMCRLPIPLGPALAESVPEVEGMFRFREGTAVLGAAPGVTQQEEVVFADENLFTFFSFRLRSGNPRTVLAGPRSVVLTESLARRYFGEADPIGKPLTVNVGRPETYTVTGVAEEPPGHSSLRFGVLLPLRSEPQYQQYKDEQLNYFAVLTLVKVREGVSPAALGRKLDGFARRYFAENIQAWRKGKLIGPRETGIQVTAMPLPAVHFDNAVMWPRTTSRLYGYILGSVAGLILLIACINYISLALTNAASRTQEVGLRKVMGASRRQVTLQLWVETQVLVAVAVGAGLALALLLLPAFNAFADRQLVVNPFRNPELLGALLGLGLLVGTLAGGYPAALLAGFNPVKVLKSNRTHRFNPALSRGLVVVQYAVCLFLITAALVMYRQMQYVLRKDLGFDQARVLVVENPEKDPARQKRVWERMQQYAAGRPGIAAVAGASASFGKGSMIYFFTINGQNRPVDVFDVDYNYLPLLGIPLVQGRNFSPQHPTDSVRKEAVIINETLARQLGDDARVGEVSQQLKMRVVGIVKDYHYASLEMKIGPALLWLNPSAASTLLVKLTPGHGPGTLAQLAQDWKTMSGGQPFNYSFLDGDISTQYREYSRWMNLLGLAAGFAILVACLGLFGLSGLNAVNRTREVGIRKVLGASVGQVLLLLNRDVVRLAAVSFVLAVPGAWYLMRRWLQDFAYRVEIGPEVFVAAGVAGLLTALLAVSYHSLKAALANPVDSLRSE